jgi:hypothetical protein
MKVTDQDRQTYLKIHRQYKQAKVKFSVEGKLTKVTDIDTQEHAKLKGLITDKDRRKTSNSQTKINTEI